MSIQFSNLPYDIQFDFIKHVDNASLTNLMNANYQLRSVAIDYLFLNKNLCLSSFNHLPLLQHSKKLEKLIVKNFSINLKKSNLFDHLPECLKTIDLQSNQLSINIENVTICKQYLMNFALICSTSLKEFKCAFTIEELAVELIGKSFKNLETLQVVVHKVTSIEFLKHLSLLNTLDITTSNQVSNKICLPESIQKLSKLRKIRLFSLDGFTWNIKNIHVYLPNLKSLSVFPMNADDLQFVFQLHNL